MRIDASLTDQLESWKSLEEGASNQRTLANQHQHVCMLQTMGKNFDVLDVIIPNRDIVLREQSKTWQAAQCVEIIIQN